MQMGREFQAEGTAQQSCGSKKNEWRGEQTTSSEQPQVRLQQRLGQAIDSYEC